MINIRGETMKKDIILELEKELSFSFPKNTRFEESDTYKLTHTESTTTVYYSVKTDIARALLKLKEKGIEKPFTDESKLTFDSLGIMIDCSRNAVRTVSFLKQTLRHLAFMGYTTVQLYTEDTFLVDGFEYIGYLRGAYSKEELKELDDYAHELGIEMIPCIQTLAHLNQMKRWYPHLFDIDDILLVDSDETYKFIESMVKTVKSVFRSKKINIGMDEANMVGLGKYLNIHGYQNRFEILLRHLNKVVSIVTNYGYEPMMWSDMFFRLENNGSYYGDKVPLRIKDLIPREVSLVYWDYYHTDTKDYDRMMDAHRQLKDELIFAGGSWLWKGIVPNNTFSIRTVDGFIPAARKHGVNHIFTTTWGDNGAEASLFSVLPSLFYLSERAYGLDDKNRIKERFEVFTGIPFDDFVALDEADFLGEDINYVANPSKYFLYNDPLLGLFDGLAKKRFEESIQVIKKKLKPHLDSKYGYIFKSIYDLLNVLSIKITLGIQTRDAYRKNDKEHLLKLIDELYPNTIKNINTFYHSFSKQWHHENKPHGFDVEDIRIGGLLKRMEVAHHKLRLFYNQSIMTIHELDEDIKPISKGENTHIYFNNWRTIVSVNIV